MNSVIKTTDSPRHTSLPASLLKGAAVNTVIQALGGKLKKETFFKTLLVGALGGAVENLSGNIVLPGILIGGGNALINKSNVPRTMFKYAAWSLAAQGIKTIGEAKAADDPSEWNVEWDMQLPNGALKRIVQEDYEYGCTQATLKSIAAYLGRPIVNEGERKGYDFAAFAKMNGFQTTDLYYGDYEIGNSEIRYSSVDQLYLVVGGYLKRGWPVAVTFYNGHLDHTIGVWRIVKKRHTVKNDKVRYEIKVTDSAKVDYITSLSSDLFERALIRAVNPN